MMLSAKLVLMQAMLLSSKVIEESKIHTHLCTNLISQSDNYQNFSWMTVKNFKIQICFNVIFCYGVGCAYYPEDSDEEARDFYVYRTTPDKLTNFHLFFQVLHIFWQPNL